MVPGIPGIVLECVGFCCPETGRGVTPPARGAVSQEYVFTWYTWYSFGVRRVLLSGDWPLCHFPRPWRRVAGVRVYIVYLV